MPASDSAVAATAMHGTHPPSHLATAPPGHDCLGKSCASAVQRKAARPMQVDRDGVRDCAAVGRVVGRLGSAGPVAGACSANCRVHLQLAGLATSDPRERMGRMPATSVNNPVVCLGAALADPAIVHPAYRFALLALSADSEVSRIVENARCGCIHLRIRCVRRKILIDRPG